MPVGTPPRCLRSCQEVLRRPRTTAHRAQACHGPLASGVALASSEAPRVAAGRSRRRALRKRRAVASAAAWPGFSSRRAYCDFPLGRHRLLHAAGREEVAAAVRPSDPSRYFGWLGLSTVCFNNTMSSRAFSLSGKWPCDALAQPPSFALAPTPATAGGLEFD